MTYSKIIFLYWPKRSYEAAVTGGKVNPTLMLPSVPYDLVPRTRSLEASASGPATVRSGLMAGVPGCPPVGSGPLVAPAPTVSVPVSGAMLSSNVIKAGTLLQTEEEVSKGGGGGEEY